MCSLLVEFRMGAILDDETRPRSSFFVRSDGATADLLDHVAGEFLVSRLELLQADNVGLSLLEPARENREPPIDAIDVCPNTEARQVALRSMRSLPNGAAAQ